MPWMSIVVWLVSFLVSKSSGASNAKAALVATGAGLATYYLADPSNQDNVFGVRFGSDSDPGTDNPGVDGDPRTESGPAVKAPSPSIGQTVVSEAGGVLKSWGPTGTLGVVAGTTALTKDSKKWLPWIGLGFFVLLLTR